ncbi:ATP-dependent endonuclease [Arthrobacter sp. TPD3018]|uniref:ATP-binding protein n=1 Tax=Bacteria TaxID=2 RepID=UPI000D50F529|nr:MULTISPECIES: ATP-binding protein [Bacteria]PVE52788.1 ATP-dependent endonuclease [Sphingomonas sp. TPD3009]PVE52975.1 ATP-dependent endonuclease [Arthrobacter sp. TPD3018]PVE81360.1 ATP-dependent endonuclease [Sphingomonas melonis]
MRIETVRIVNLRAFADETIKLDEYTTIVGPNGSGKSTLLCALNIFFREVDGSPLNIVQLDAEDFHNRETGKPIEITVTFHNLTDVEIEEFSDYVRDGKLIVTARAVFDQDRQVAPVVQYGSRLAMEDFAPYFEADKAGASAATLKAMFGEIREKHPDVDGSSTVKDRMASALRTYEGANPNLCTVIPSEDQFYGVGQVGKLRRFIQWVYIPAVKDASGEQSEARNTAFGKLVERTIRAKINFADEIDAIREEARGKYVALIESKKEVLDEVSGQLQQRLSEWSIPDATARLDWHQDPKGAVRVDAPMTKLIAGDGQFEGNIARFGHGLQRSYLIALLHGLASEDDSAQPTLILGCEEPELYQHPPQARHLASVLESLSDKNSQVIITTHSPLFVDGKGFESVRLIRRNKETKSAVATSMSLSDLSGRLSAASGDPPLLAEGTLAKLNQAMQLTLSDMFFTTKLVIVEGL